VNLCLLSQWCQWRQIYCLGFCRSCCPCFIGGSA
jgi:hypothetical protein